MPVGDGYRGGALNLAARLCARPPPGRSSASQGSCTSPAPSRASTIATAAADPSKGIADPVHVVCRVARGADVAEHMRAFSPSASGDAASVEPGQAPVPRPRAARGRRGRGPIPLGGPKQRAVLAHLLVRANAARPSRDPGRRGLGRRAAREGRANIIQTYVSHLRQGPRRRSDPGSARPATACGSIPPSWTPRGSTPSSATRRRPSRSTRTSRSRTLDDALALWRGPALADLADQPSLFAEAARLDELRLEAQEARIEGLLATGRRGPGDRRARGAARAPPLRENGCGACSCWPLPRGAAGRGAGRLPARP